MTDPTGRGDFDVLIRTGLNDPVAIGLAGKLLEEAGIPFFTMDRKSGERELSRVVDHSGSQGTRSRSARNPA
jgi:hypothetical protein